MTELRSQTPSDQSAPETEQSKAPKSKLQTQSENLIDVVPPPSKGNRRGGRKRGQAVTQIQSESSSR